MKGYHYTTYKNWLVIKKQGLVPTCIKRHDVIDHLTVSNYPTPFNAVWLWKTKPSKKGHLNALLFQLADKDDYKLVMLEVEYSKKDLLGHERGDTFDIEHTTSIGDSRANFSKEKSVLVVNKIPVENIKLLEIYDFNFIERLCTKRA